MKISKKLKGICECGSEFSYYFRAKDRGHQIWCSKKCVANNPERIRRQILLTVGNKNNLGKHWKVRDTSRMGKSRIGIKRPDVSLRFSGSKNHRWISDRSKLCKRQERNDMAYKEWRRCVKNRDGWKCKISNSECSGRVVAHHILPWAKYPELRYQINNGITLCQFHHPLTRNGEKMLSPYFQGMVSATAK